MRRSLLVVAIIVVSVLVAAGGAGATVIDTSAFGKSSVAYNPNGQESYVGVDLVPGAAGPSSPPNRSAATIDDAKIAAVTSNPPCQDPALTSDLGGPLLPFSAPLTPRTALYGQSALCSHGGSVMHSNETFVVAWDPVRRYFAGTKSYVEQFLKDVADGSGSFTSPYAVTSQYTDGSGRAAYNSLYGGACTDFGNAGGATCQFGSSNGSGPGHDYSYYPEPDCPVSGTNYRAGPSLTSGSNDVCVTDAKLRHELATMIAQTGIAGHTKPGYSPLMVVLTPPGVETCIDSTDRLCSANADPNVVSARFCSYHSQVLVNGTEYPYVVQPWTAETGSSNGCDEPEPDVDPIPNPVDTQLLAKYIGERLVSPLSQSMIAAIVNPALNGWFALNGSEIDDWFEVVNPSEPVASNLLYTGCVPEPKGLDKVAVGSSSQNPYVLQREFNNAGVIETDPNALACTPIVDLEPRFVVPSSVNQGDVVEFDGSTTVSSLIVPRANYFWDFGDGTTASGPSVVHAYTKGGTYAVKLTVVDRGGNTSSLSQSITVLGSNGQPVSGGGTGSGGGGGATSKPVLQVRLQLLPQGLRSMLRSGVSMRVTSNEAANGIVTISISRSAARRAHIKTGHGSSVVIGRGTVSRIKAGTVKLHLRLSRITVAKLKRLRHLTLTIRIALVDAGGVHRAFVAAGRY